MLYKLPCQYNNAGIDLVADNVYKIMTLQYLMSIVNMYRTERMFERIFHDIFDIIIFNVGNWN